MKIIKKFYPMPYNKQYELIENLKENLLIEFNLKNNELSNSISELIKRNEIFDNNILKRLYGIEEYEEKVDKIFDLSEKMKDDILNIIQNQTKSSDDYRVFFKNNKENETDKTNLLNYLKSIIEYNIALYYKNVEYEYYKNELEKKFIEIKDFDKRFVKLVNGLNEKSIEIVSLIINRLNILCKLDIPILNIFSKEEQEKICELRQHFYSNIIKLNENLFFYRNYFLPINHFEPCVFYYKHSIDNIKNLESIKNKDIIDAGGFIGDSILILSPLTNKKIYSFEPSPKNYNHMIKTIELNKINNAVAEQYALSSERKVLEFNLNDSASTEYKNDAFEYSETIQVQAISLDEYVLNNNLEVGLIKTDLEGAEKEFLKGAIETIRRDKPILLVSIYHSIDDFLDIKPMIESWGLGYKFKIVKPIDGSIMFETMLIAEVY